MNPNRSAFLVADTIAQVPSCAWVIPHLEAFLAVLARPRFDFGFVVRSCSTDSWSFRVRRKPDVRRDSVNVELLVSRAGVRACILRISARSTGLSIFSRPPTRDSFSGETVVLEFPVGDDSTRLRREQLGRFPHFRPFRRPRVRRAALHFARILSDEVFPQIVGPVMNS